MEDEVIESNKAKLHQFFYGGAEIEEFGLVIGGLFVKNELG